MINTTLKFIAPTQLVTLKWANGYQFNYWDQIVETKGYGVAPSPTIWKKLMKGSLWVALDFGRSIQIGLHGGGLLLYVR